MCGVSVRRMWIGFTVACLTLRCSWECSLFFFLMIRRPPRSTLDRSSAASDVYKRQVLATAITSAVSSWGGIVSTSSLDAPFTTRSPVMTTTTVSYTHLRAHETVLDLVCRLLLEKQQIQSSNTDKQCSEADNTQESSTVLHGKTYISYSVNTFA